MYRAYVPTQNVDAFIRHLTLKETECISNLIKELRSGSLNCCRLKIPSESLGFFVLKVNMKMLKLFRI
jgi:hypothetical protein